jgi:hypothetical protein
LEGAVESVLRGDASCSGQAVALLVVTPADQEDTQSEGEHPRGNQAYDPDLPRVLIGEQSYNTHQYADAEQESR